MKLAAATWRPVRNYGGLMGSHTGLVVHVQQGDGSLFGWFNNPASQVSSHFWIAKTGVMEQYVDTDNQAWAQAAGNAGYLSVETEGLDSEPLTDPQLQNLAALIRWCHVTFGITPTMVDHGGVGVTTHAHYPSETPDPAWGGHPCPGSIRTAQLAHLVAGLNPPPPILPEEDLFCIAAYGQQVKLWTGAKFVPVVNLAELDTLTQKLGVPLHDFGADVATFDQVLAVYSR